MARKKWNRHTILAELRGKGITLNALADRYGISRHSVGHIWKRANAPAEAAIADFIGVPVEELWEDFGRYPKRTATILSSKYDGLAASQNSSAKLDVRDAA